MLDKEQIEQIINMVITIDENTIANNGISFDDLKVLTLLTFNECLMSEFPNPLIKSYLTIALNHFIECENNRNQENDSIVANPIEEPLSEKKEENNNISKLQEEIIHSLIHGRAPII